RFTRRDVLVVAEVLDLLFGRDVQNMDALARLAGELDQALGRHQRRGLVAPDGMRARIALDAEPLAVVEAVFVLRVKGSSPPYYLEYPAQTLVVLDQQRAGRRADEHLHPGTAGRAFELGQVLNVLAGTADEEGEIAMHAMPAALDLVGEGLLRHRQRIGVRHLEHGGHPAHDRAARARLQIFLVGQPGLAEMHLRVHHAGQDMQALAIDDFGGARPPQSADFGDAARANADVAHALAVLVDHGAGF